MTRRFNLVADEKANARADIFVINELREQTDEDYSRSFIQSLFEQGAVLVNGAPALKSRIITCGDVVELTLEPPCEIEAKPQDISLDIVYEDGDLLVVNKPKGMVVHPAAGNPDGTLVNALLFHCKSSLSGINGVLRPGIVHRIDKDTSGLLVVAKNDMAHRSLAEQIQLHNATREYEAVVHGRIRDAGFVEMPIGRSPNDRKKFCVTNRNSKYAYTSYEPLAQYVGYTHIKCILKTGRTHQIRVHMSYIGHSVAGDRVYGGSNEPAMLEGQCLHARRLGFVHPSTGERLEFASELPEYFTSFLATLKKEE